MKSMSSAQAQPRMTWVHVTYLNEAATPCGQPSPVAALATTGNTARTRNAPQSLSGSAQIGAYRFELGIQVPRADAGLDPLARTFLRCTAYEGKGSSYQFCEGGLNTLSRGCHQEGMDQYMVCAHRAFHHPQKDLMQWSGILRIGIASERTVRDLFRRAPIGAFHFFTDPVIAHGGFPTQFKENRMCLPPHFRATGGSVYNARSVSVVGAQSMNDRGTAFLAIHSEREYPTTPGPGGVPLAANVSKRSTSSRPQRSERSLR